MKVLFLVVVLVWIPVAALVGGLLTRDGQPLGQFVARHFRVLSTATWLLVAVATLMFRHDDSSLLMAIRVPAWALYAAMFMPSPRSLEGSTNARNLSDRRYSLSLITGLECGKVA